MSVTTDDLRIQEMQELISPEELIAVLPVSETVSDTVSIARRSIHKILTGEDDRLLVVVGPCSIHDPESAMEYATRLKALSEQLSDNLFIVMRVYFEKPRTTVGWKGLINDPDLDNSFQITKGLHLARRLLLDLGEMGIPCGTEYLDLISPQYVADWFPGERSAQGQPRAKRIGNFRQDCLALLDSKTQPMAIFR